MKKIKNIVMLVVVAFTLFACENENKENFVSKEEFESLNTELNDLKNKYENLTNSINKNTSSIDTLDKTVFEDNVSAISGFNDYIKHELKLKYEDANEIYFVANENYKDVEESFKEVNIQTFFYGSSNMEAVSDFMSKNKLQEKDLVIIPFDYNDENSNDLFLDLDHYANVFSKNNFCLLIDYCPVNVDGDLKKRDEDKLRHVIMYMNEFRCISTDSSNSKNKTDAYLSSIIEYLGFNNIKHIEMKNKITYPVNFPEELKQK